MKEGDRPAFPIPIHSTECPSTEYPCPCGNIGMTLRQWYAGMALSAIIARDASRDVGYNQKTDVAEAFEYADAMLAEGTKREQEGT